MLVNLLGYDKVEYSKDGEDRSFVKTFVCESHESGKITFGYRCAEVLCSCKYFEKIQNSMSSGQSLHLGWERGSHRPFLYTK